MNDINNNHNSGSSEIENNVLETIAEKIGSSKDSIDVNDHLFDDLNASKLEKAEIIASLEDKYGITFDAEQLPVLNTPLSIIEYLTDNVE